MADIRRQQKQDAANRFAAGTGAARPPRPARPAARTEASSDLRRDRNPVLLFALLAATALLIIDIFGGGTPF